MANSGKAERERQHRAATAWASSQQCAICGRTPCEPCHWPGGHRGMGGGKAGWDLSEVWAGCRYCHNLVDGRLGVSNAVEAERELAIKRLTRRNA